MQFSYFKMVKILIKQFFPNFPFMSMSKIPKNLICIAFIVIKSMLQKCGMTLRWQLKFKQKRFNFLDDLMFHAVLEKGAPNSTD